MNNLDPTDPKTRKEQKSGKKKYITLGTPKGVRFAVRNQELHTQRRLAVAATKDKEQTIVPESKKK